MILWVKAFHIISLVAWFAGLFYLPRLFVYHANSHDQISLDRFKIMENRLYKAITTPAAILTTIFGLWLLSYGFSAYLAMGWMDAKLGLVILLWGYHIYLGILLRQFSQNRNTHSALFYRILNEVPTVFLIVIVILAIVRP